MNSSLTIAKHYRDVHFGGNWTDVNLQDALRDVTWEQATKQVNSLNTIASLVFHINYFIAGVLQVLEGGPLESKDKYSFNLPPIKSQLDWQSLVNKTLKDAERFALLVEKIPEEKLWEDFTDKKYGNYYSNLIGIIEHTHYHLGQIMIIKKILSQ